MTSTRAEPVSPGRSGERLPALDGLRGIAIALVMVYHFVAAATVPASGNRFDLLVARISGGGWTGVELFFVLSGFLITGILLDARSTDAPYLRTFYGRRVLRIFPLYYGALFGMLVILPQLQTLDPTRLTAFRAHELWYWTYMHNMRLLFGGSPGSDLVETWHLWSLAIEEQYYLVWPAVVLVLNRRQLLFACAGLIAFSFGLRVVMGISGANQQLIYQFTPARMDGLAAGSALAVMVRSPSTFERCSRWLTYAAPVAVCALVAILVAHRALDPYDRLVQTFGLLPIAVLASAALARALGAAAGSRTFHFFTLPVLRSLGRYSYGLYVIHWPVAVALQRDTTISDWPPTLGGSYILGRVLFFVVAGAITGSVAWLSWHLYEKQFLKARALLPYVRRRAAAPSSAS